MQHFSATELHQYLQDNDTPPLLLDVREPWEFERCAIDGSILIPMGQIQSRLEELDPSRETIMICHHGVRSRHIGMQLEHVGFSRIINLSGGVNAWARDVDHNMEVY